MRILSIIICTAFLSLTLVGQRSDYFIFKTLDRAVLNLWLAETTNTQILLDLEKEVSIEWVDTYNQISESDFIHFDKVGFLDDQGARLKYIHELLVAEKFVTLEKELYIFLSEFREVRACFTNDFYILDEVLDSYQAYLDMHDIIHDQMMGLYEWTEFVWHVDQLKCSIEEMELKFSEVEGVSTDRTMRSALAKLNNCLATLDDSLGNAYRPDFELPCNELQLAFKDLLRAFGNSSSI